MISKELFNAVMGSDLKDICVFDDCVIWDLSINLKEDGYYSFVYGDRNTIINIHDLAFVKCIKWANKNNFERIVEFTEFQGAVLLQEVIPTHNKECKICKEWFVEDLTTDAIFKACQWILDNK